MPSSRSWSARRCPPASSATTAWGGYTPVHLLVPLTFAGLGRSFWHLYHGNIAGHRKIMRSVYIGACVVAGLFTLLPGRYLGDLLWQQLGLA